MQYHITYIETQTGWLIPTLPGNTKSSHRYHDCRLLNKPFLFCSLPTCTSGFPSAAAEVAVGTSPLCLGKVWPQKSLTWCCTIIKTLQTGILSGLYLKLQQDTERVVHQTAAECEWGRIKVKCSSFLRYMSCAQAGVQIPTCVAGMCLKHGWAEPGLRQHCCVRPHTICQYFGLEGTCESPSTTPLHWAGTSSTGTGCAEPCQPHFQCF